MPYSVKGFFEINEDMVQILLMLEVLFTQNSKVADLFCGASSGSEPSLFFSNYFFSLGFQPIQDDFQHDFARMTDEADSSVVLAELQVALLGSVIITWIKTYNSSESRKENPQKLTQLSSRSHPRHLVGKGTAQKDTIIDITSDSQVNSNFPYRWSPASLTFNNYFYLFLYLYIT